eukprot:gene1240-52621_t
MVVGDSDGQVRVYVRPGIKFGAAEPLLVTGTVLTKVAP